jgi:hypothetical protein
VVVEPGHGLAGDAGKAEGGDQGAGVVGHGEALPWRPGAGQACLRRAADGFRQATSCASVG